MFARWRVLALLTLLITVLRAFGPVAASTWSANDRISQVGEIGTLPARRSEGTVLEPELGDDGPAHSPTRVEPPDETFDTTEPAAPRPSFRRSLEWVGSSNPRGPPLLL